MTAGAVQQRPVVGGRDWLPTPRMSAPAVALPAVLIPAPRVSSEWTWAPARREDHLTSSDEPFVRVLGGPAAAAPVPDSEPAEAPVEVVPPAPRRWVLGTLLNLAAVVGIGMSGVTAYAATHQLHPLVVRSGSMAPVIATGSMVLVETIPAAQIRVGDVVAVRRPDGVTVTHRVVRLSRDGELAQLILKGDANKTEDPDPVPVASAGRLVWSAPVLGRVAAFTASARGGFVLGVVVGAVLLSLRRRSP